MSSPAPKLGRLCLHARINNFKCGKNLFDFNLASYQQRFLDGDETFVYTLETELRHVVGYISTYDMIAESPTRSTRWFCLPAFAVAEGSQGTNYAMRLVNHVYRIAQLRQTAHIERTGRKRYDAIACANHTGEIEKALRRLGFKPTKPDEKPCWWIRSVEGNERVRRRKN